MLNQSAVVRRPYRGYGIVVQVAELERASFNGTESRYTVSWSVQREGPLANTVASFPKTGEFLSVGEALDYGVGEHKSSLTPHGRLAKAR